MCWACHTDTWTQGLEGCLRRSGPCDGGIGPSLIFIILFNLLSNIYDDLRIPITTLLLRMINFST